MADMQKQVTDVVVVGGGVIGCAIAYFLRKANIAVTVLEQGNIGGHASSMSAGLLAPLGPLAGPGPFADLLLKSFRLFPTLVAELEAVSGLHVGYERTGALRVVRNPKRLIRLRERVEEWRPLGVPVYWLDGEAARQREPLLAADICGAVYVPEEAQIDAAQFTLAWAGAAQKLGAHMYSQTTVSEFLRSGTTINGVKTIEGNIFTCKYVVVAAGAWSAEFANVAHVVVPVRPIRGQMLALPQPELPSSILRHIIFGERSYLIPRGNEILVGASNEDSGFDAHVTGEGIAKLHATALRLMPSLSTSAIVRRWAGLRPGTPDKRPILGPVPGWENLLLATGHNSVGIMLSPLSGQGIAEYITSGLMPTIMWPFALERFSMPANSTKIV